MALSPNDFKAGLDASDLVDIIEQVTSSLRQERAEQVITGGIINGGLVELENPGSLAVIGDIHGDIKSLRGILRELNYDTFLADPKNKIIFLGDYVDRGNDSIGVLYTVLRLKRTYPNSVILMRGNHEAPKEFPFSSHDLPYELVDRFGEYLAKKIYDKILSLFRILTLATVIRGTMLLIHGGLPTLDEVIANYRNYLSRAQEDHTTNSVLEEILWNDPRKIDGNPWWEHSRRGIGRHFGATITAKWLKATQTKSVVRGHEPCQGFRIDHDRMIMTIFSSKEAYPSFKPAYLFLPAEMIPTVNDALDLTAYVRFPALP